MLIELLLVLSQIQKAMWLGILWVNLNFGVIDGIAQSIKYAKTKVFKTYIKGIKSEVKLIE